MIELQVKWLKIYINILKICYYLCFKNNVKINARIYYRLKTLKF